MWQTSLLNGLMALLGNRFIMVKKNTSQKSVTFEKKLKTGLLLEFVRGGHVGGVK